MPGDIWGALLIIGPLVLFGVIVWAWWRNRTASRASVERAERGAQALREEIERSEGGGSQPR